MGLLSAIGSLFKPVAELVDAVHTSEEEKLAARAELMVIQARILSEVAQHETKLIEAQSKIIVAEAQSQSWLTRNWRPLLMVTFTYIVVHNYVLVPLFGAQPVDIPDEMWGLLKLGVGGYIGARTIEKVSPKIVEIVKR